MRSSPLPLRLLVALGLIFNGPGLASHASITPIEPAPVTAVAQNAPHDDDAPCPEHTATTHEQGTTGDGSPTTPDPALSDHGAPGCCGSGACAGSCVVHVPASVAHWVSTALPMHGDAARPLLIAHASPALPPRVRPPIT